MVADLLLDRGDGDDVDPRAAGLGDAPRRLERDIGAEPVVERLRDERGRSGARADRRCQTPASPTRDERGGLVAVRRRRCRCAGRRARASARSRAASGRPARRASTPGDGAVRGRRCTTRCPTSVSARSRRGCAKASRPLSSTWVTATPISSMWPITASVGAAAPRRATRAKEVPRCRRAPRRRPRRPSRQTAAAGSSCPEGPTRPQEVVEEGGNRHGLRIQPGSAYRGRTMILLPVHELVVLARERGGSVRLTGARQPAPLDPKTRKGLFLSRD